MICSFDIETTGLRPYHGDRIFSYCIGKGDTGEVDVVRVDGKGNPGAGFKRLREFFLDTTIEKVAHNAKFEMGFLSVHGIVVPEKTVWHDTMIMSQVLRNDLPKHSLDYLAWKFGRYKCEEDDIVSKQAKARGGYQHVDTDVMERYQIADGERTLILYHTFVDSVREYWNVYRQEIDLLTVTQKMEEEGVKLHLDNLTKMQQTLSVELASIRKEANKQNGKDINLNSSREVGKLLYEKLGYPVTTITEGGATSVDKNVLLAFRKTRPHPVLELILKNRSYVRALGAMDGYIKNKDGNNKLHPNIKTNHAGTGRESCENPNLQNVEKEAGEKNIYPVALRSVFRADYGCSLLFADYAGIEMRLIIGATEEPELVQILKQNGDVHHPTVCCFLGDAEAGKLMKTDPKRYKVLRSAFKNTGFCIAYGGGVNKVALTLGKPVQEIMAGDTAYRSRFPRIAEFSRLMIRQVERCGFVTTAQGRRLYVPRDTAHAGSNYLIQGTAAGILKRAQVTVAKMLHKRYGNAVQMILPIHDEIVIQVRNTLVRQEGSVDVLRNEIREAMIDQPDIGVPLDVEFKFSTSTWDKAK